MLIMKFVLAVRNILPSTVTHYVDPRDAIVLGTPVGGDIIIDTVLHCKLNEFRRLAESLKNLNTNLLCSENCFSLPKLVYALRSALCCDSQIINQYDMILHAVHCRRY